MFMKIKKIFYVFIVLLSVLLLTSCKSIDTKELNNKTFEMAKLENRVEGKELIGLLLLKKSDVKTDVSGTIYELYQESFVGLLPDGEYELIYIEENSERIYPSIKAKGYYFAGTYVNKDGEFTRINDISNDDIVYVRYISFTDAALMSLICIFIVFMILIVVCLIVSLFKFKKTKQPTEEVKEAVKEQKQRIRIEDITDPDMQIAAVVASIDYYNEIKKDVRIVSIKEIK